MNHEARLRDDRLIEMDQPPRKSWNTRVSVLAALAALLGTFSLSLALEKMGGRSAGGLMIVFGLIVAPVVGLVTFAFVAITLKLIDLARGRSGVPAVPEPPSASQRRRWLAAVLLLGALAALGLWILTEHALRSLQYGTALFPGDILIVAAVMVAAHVALGYTSSRKLGWSLPHAIILSVAASVGAVGLKLLSANP